jgi:hypothetical protein
VSKEELVLLLTCARVLRAQLKEIGSNWADEDIQALNDALAPWDGAQDKSAENTGNEAR